MRFAGTHLAAGWLNHVPASCCLRGEADVYRGNELGLWLEPRIRGAMGDDNCRLRLCADGSMAACSVPAPTVPSLLSQ